MGLNSGSCALSVGEEVFDQTRAGPPVMMPPPSGKSHLNSRVLATVGVPRPAANERRGQLGPFGRPPSEQPPREYDLNSRTAHGYGSRPSLRRSRRPLHG